MTWTSMPKLFLVLLRKTYKRYISASREFIHFKLLALLWVSLNENSMEIWNSHNILYIT